MGRPTVIKIIKPFLQKAFENNIDGLVDEARFELENEKNENITGKYSGNYWKYYQTRVKTLTGL